MVDSLEMYIVYCVVLVMMIVPCLRLNMTNLLTSKSTDSPVSTETSVHGAKNLYTHISAYCAENPGVLMLWSGSNRAVIGKSFRPPPFCYGKYYCKAKKYRYCAKSC
jgi:hypothetical protein